MEFTLRSRCHSIAVHHCHLHSAGETEAPGSPLPFQHTKAGLEFIKRWANKHAQDPCCWAAQ